LAGVRNGVMRRKTKPSVNDMFDVVPKPDRDLVRREIRKKCKHLVEELDKISRSSLGRSEPDFPSKQLLDSLLELIQQYREISKRK